MAEAISDALDTLRGEEDEDDDDQDDDAGNSDDLD
jgi:hypothetical protein